MLKTVGFNNYKSYDNGEIEFKPITILLGANSSGKSSILQLLLMIEQTLNLDGGYESALKLNGKYIGLGEVENIFRNKLIDKPLTFSFGINSKQSGFHMGDIRRLKRNLEADIFDLYYKFKKLEDYTTKEKFAYISGRNIHKSQDISADDISFFIKEIKRIKRHIAKSKKVQTELFEDDLKKYIIKKRMTGASGEIKNLMKVEVNEYFDAYKLLDAIIKKKFGEFNIEFEIKYLKKSKSLGVSKISVNSKNFLLLEYHKKSINGQIKHILNSQVCDNKILNKYRVRFGKNVEFDTLNLKAKADGTEAQRFRMNSLGNEVFCTYVLRIFKSFTAQLNMAFHPDRINYISPLRAFPKRYYFLDESNVSSSLDSIDGDNLTEILKKEKSIQLKVNEWLNKFGLTVGIEDVKEVIHRLKVGQNGLNLDITDVGFGISQVLPIIVQGFLSKENSLTIIEQPEIHLHPMMQAELADLFIDVVTPGDGKVLLIETHSEAILKRLRRRIAEGQIQNTDVAIYFVNGRKKKSLSTKIERLEISKTGAFDWPQEFYSTDFEDTTEFLKYQ